MVNKKSLKPYLPLIFSLLLGLFLFFLVEDFFNTFIIRPLLYVIWFFYLVIQSIPQALIWFGFILAMLVISYSRWARKKQSSMRTGKLSLSRKSSPVEKWTRLLKNAQISRLSKWRVAQELKILTWNVLAPHQDEQDSRVDLSCLSLPQEINDYFAAPQPSNSPPGSRHAEAQKALDLEPEVVIRYLEEQLQSLK
jgi:hypothetical protein